MTKSGNEVIRRAMNERLIATLSAPGAPAGPWQVRFLPVAAEEGGTWVQPIDEKNSQLNAHISAATDMHVAFNLDHTRYGFRTSIARRDKHLWVTEKMMVEALLLRETEDVRIEERRAHRRLQVPDGCAVVADMHRRGVPAPQILRVKLWDISPAGAGFICPFRTWIGSIQPGEVLQVTMSFGRSRITAGWAVRFSRILSNRTVKVGGQLQRDSIDRSSRAALEELLEEVHQLELRRHGARH